jgi:hypothetical protein
MALRNLIPLDGRVLLSGKTIRIRFKCVGVPSSRGLPDWVIGDPNNAIFTLSNGLPLKFNGVTEFGSCPQFFKLNWTESTKTISGSNGEFTDYIHKPGTIVKILQIANGGTNIIDDADHVVTSKINNNSIQLADSISSSGQTGDKTGKVDGYFYDVENSVAMIWEAEFILEGQTDVIKYGDVVLFNCSADLLVDRYGNSNAATTSMTLTNYSWVDSTGFAKKDFAKGTGAVELFVSWSNGTDTSGGRTIAQGQVVTTPYKTISSANKALLDNGHRDDGSIISVLQGDDYTDQGIGGAFGYKCNGQDRAHPAQIRTYWFNYGNGTGVQGHRPKINIGAIGGLDGGGGGGAGSTSAKVLIQGIHFINSSTVESGMRMLLDGDDVMFSDCVIEGGGFNVQKHGSSRFTINRCIIKDCILTTSGHQQGIYIEGTLDLEIVGNCWDNNGFKSLDGKTDIFCHTFYLHKGCGPVSIWGNYINRGAATVFNGNCGGMFVRNVCAETAFGGHLRKSGAIRLNYFERSNDILDNDNGGAVLPRGWGFALALHEYTSSGVIELNTIVNTISVGSELRALYVEGGKNYKCDDFLIRNNTVYKAGGIFYLETVANESALPRHLVSMNNLIDTRASAFAVYWDQQFVNAKVWGNGSKNNALFMNAGQEGRLFKISNSFKDFNFFVSITGEVGDISSGPSGTLGVSLPTYVNNTADLGTYYNSIGGSNSRTAFRDFLRNRELDTWSANYNPINALYYMMAQYVPIGLPTVVSPPMSYYGSGPSDPFMSNGGSSVTNPSVTAVSCSSTVLRVTYNENVVVGNGLTGILTVGSRFTIDLSLLTPTYATNKMSVNVSTAGTINSNDVLTLVLGAESAKSSANGGTSLAYSGSVTNISNVDPVATYPSVVSAACTGSVLTLTFDMNVFANSAVAGILTSNGRNINLAGLTAIIASNVVTINFSSVGNVYSSEEVSLVLNSGVFKSVDNGGSNRYSGSVTNNSSTSYPNDFLSRMNKHGGLELIGIL